MALVISTYISINIILITYYYPQYLGEGNKHILRGCFNNIFNHPTSCFSTLDSAWIVSVGSENNSIYIFSFLQMHDTCVDLPSMIRY